MKNRLRYYDKNRAIQWLKNARSWGVSIDRLKEVAITCKNWTDFGNQLDIEIEQVKKLEEEKPSLATEESVNPDVLKKACRQLASIPSPFGDSLSKEDLEHVVEVFYKYASEKVSDYDEKPYVVLVAIRYLTSALDFPPISLDEFRVRLDTLIELACPNIYDSEDTLPYINYLKDRVNNPDIYDDADDEVI